MGQKRTAAITIIRRYQPDATAVLQVLTQLLAKELNEHPIEIPTPTLVTREITCDVEPVHTDRREFRAEWLDRPFLLVDTGGWELTPDGELTQDIRSQTEAALVGADAPRTRRLHGLP